MSKHTPGPWHVGDLDHNDQRVVNGEHIEICTCWHHSVISLEKQMEANARLIAAAPKLLAACKAAEKLAWEVGCETVDGVHTILEDSRGDLWRQLSAVIAEASE